MKSINFRHFSFKKKTSLSSLEIIFREINLYCDSLGENQFHVIFFLNATQSNFLFQNADKETAIHSAAQYGHLDAVKLLLKHGADPNIKNCRDETALDLAALYGR